MVPSGVAIRAAVVSQPEGDLPNLHAGVNAEWLNYCQFESPVGVTAEVPQVCCDIEKHSKPADRRTSEEKRYISLASDSFESGAEIYLAGLQDVPHCPQGDFARWNPIASQH